MNINIEMISKYNIAFIRQTGPYGSNNIQAMEKLKAWAEVNQLLNDETIILGIAWDNPETTKPEDCRYDTCLVILEDYSIYDDYVSRTEIIGGNYAVFEIEHTAEAIQKAWSEIFQELYEHGFQVDFTKPIIERYKYKMVKIHKCEICVPVYPK